MSEAVKKYRRTMGRVGSVLLLFLLMFYGSGLTVMLVGDLLGYYLPYEALTIVTSIASAVAYFASFTLAAWMYRLGGDKTAEPIRFDLKLPKCSFLIIFAGVGCSLALAIINGIITDLFGFVEPEELFKLPADFSGDYSIILLFIAYAIVPAVCEEILFRGVVLSNLMPHGKANAIIISAVLFGLMHGNLNQFLYTTVAGIIMGCVYVMTGSVWCSILLHLINNSVAVLRDAVSDRFSEYHGAVINIAIITVLIFVGIICAFVLFTKKRGAGEGVDLGSLTFSEEISPKDSIKGFLVPTVLSYAIISVFIAFRELG